MNSDAILELLRNFGVPGFAYVALWFFYVSIKSVDRHKRRLLWLLLVISLGMAIAGAAGIMLAWPRSSIMPLLFGQLMPILLTTAVVNSGERRESSGGG